VVTHPFDNRSGAGVPHREALTGNSVEEDFAGGGAIEDNVADQNAFFRQEARGLRRVGDDASAREAFAEIVVRVTFQFQSYAIRDEGTEALAR